VALALAGHDNVSSDTRASSLAHQSRFISIWLKSEQSPAVGTIVKSALTEEWGGGFVIDSTNMIANFTGRANELEAVDKFLAFGGAHAAVSLVSWASVFV
jgi:hypothetical protein